MGTRHDRLTEAEYRSQGSLDPRIFSQLEQHAKRLGLSPSEMRVLDYGCGRGKEVAWLRERGYEAYGVEIDTLPLENGRPFLEERGIDPQALRLLGEDSRSDFPDDFFHFVFSEQVFEHVEHLEDVSEELARITAPGGMGYHIYPPFRGAKEGHLFMPFVHWLPKNGLRRAVVRAYVALGIEPRWAQLRDKSAKEKTEVYYRYSVEQTYYRRFTEVRETFHRSGFEVSSRIMTGSRYQRSPIFRRLAGTRLMRFLVQTFRKVELVTQMPA